VENVQQLNVPAETAGPQATTTHTTLIPCTASTTLTQAASLANAEIANAALLQLQYQWHLQKHQQQYQQVQRLTKVAQESQNFFAMQPCHALGLA
jgi:hypothetical protein